jgi:predicted HTH transcriptional regulator
MLEIISKSLKDYMKENKKNVPLNVPLNVPKDVPLNVPSNVPKNVSLNRLNEIVTLIKKDKNITIIQIANILGVADKTIKRDITKLKNEGKIIRIGSLKNGYWDIKK